MAAIAGVFRAICRPRKVLYGSDSAPLKGLKTLFSLALSEIVLPKP